MPDGTGAVDDEGHGIIPAVTPTYSGAAAIVLAVMSLGASPDVQPAPVAILPAQPIWTLTLDAPPSAAGTMDDERIFVPVEGGGVRAYARDTGLLLWSDVAGTRLPPVAHGGRVFTALDAEVRALDAASGSTLWTRPLGARITAPLTLASGMLVAATEAGDVVLLRADDGGIAWQHAVGAAVRHAAVPLSSDAFAVVLDDGRVAALRVDTGDILWDRSLPESLGAPAAAEGRVFVGSTDNFFYALDDASGGEAWRWRTGGDVVGAAADGDRVYFASRDNVLRAVNRGNGNQIWKAAIPTRPAAPPIAFGDVVVVTGVSSQLEAYDGRTGASIGSYTAPADLMGEPIVDRNPQPFRVAVVIVMRDGRIAALQPTRLAFPDPPLVPLLKLPGRELLPDRPR